MAKPKYKFLNRRTGYKIYESQHDDTGIIRSIQKLSADDIKKCEMVSKCGDTDRFNVWLSTGKPIMTEEERKRIIGFLRHHNIDTHDTTTVIEYTAECEEMLSKHGINVRKDDGTLKTSHEVGNQFLRVFNTLTDEEKAIYDNSIRWYNEKRRRIYIENLENKKKQAEEERNRRDWEKFYEKVKREEKEYWDKC